jgi:hypothetical protein
MGVIVDGTEWGDQFIEFDPKANRAAQRAKDRETKMQGKSARAQAAYAAKAESQANQAAIVAARDARTGELIHSTFKIGRSLYLYANEVWLGFPDRDGSEGGSLRGVQAEVLVNGQITQRLTATRMVLLGPLALAAPKKTGNQTLLLRVSGPRFNFTYQYPGDVTRSTINSAEKLANAINNSGAVISAPAAQYGGPSVPIICG